jgi:two-component system cell cycle sensor histidine kinase/response regulator CckA
MSAESSASFSASHCLQAIADVVTDALYVKDLAGRYLYCNAAGARLAGKSVSEIVGQDDAKIFGAENAQVMRAQDRRVIALETAETEEHVVRRSGQVIYYEVTKSPYRDANGAVIGVVGVARDITKRKSAETALLRQQTVMERMAQGAPLKELLNELVLIIEEELPQSLGSILLQEPSGRLSVAAAPNLPRAYNEAINGVPIGPQVGSCGTAAHRREKVFVADIATDPLWRDYRELALSHELRACWSLPIKSRMDPDKKVLGTFAIYSRQPGLPDAHFESLMARIEYLACIAIESRKAADDLRQSEQKFRGVLDNHPAAVFIKDLDGRYLFANKFASEKTGTNQQDWIGKKASDFFPADVASQFERNDQEAIELLRPREIEEAIVLRDGETMSFLTAQFPLLERNGEPYALCEISTDITRRKRSEEALQQSVSRLLATLESTADGILVVDLEGRIVDLNQQFMNIWGFPEDLIPQGRKEDLVASLNNHTGMDGVLSKLKDPAGFIARIQQLYQTPEEPSFEVLEFRDGRVIERFSQPQRIDGKPVGRVWSFRDVTHRIQAEQELRTTAGLLQAVADGTSDAIFVKDLQGKYLFFNQGAARFVGKPISEVIGRDDTEVFEWDSALLIMERDRRVIASGVVETEEETVSAAGITRTYLATKAPYRNERGEIVGLVGISRDISDRKRAEARLRGILTSVTDSIITVNSKAQIVSVNPATEKLFEYESWELIGQGLDILMPPPYNVHASKYFSDYFRTGEKKVIGSIRELPQRRKDGTTFIGELSVSEVLMDGEPHFVGVVRDITAKKRLEEHLLQAQKLEAIGRLAGGVAHDFNNLLTVINGYAELLLSSGEFNRELISAIRSAGDRAAALTAQLLAFSRKAIIEPRVLDLNEIVEATSRMLSRLIGEDIRLVTKLAPSLAKVRMDPVQLEQILMNLAVNARDAMPRGGILELSTENVHLPSGMLIDQGNCPAGDYVELLVVDNGDGMSEAVQNRIFEPFFTTKETGKGTGLGLATVYGIVRQASGAISVDSQVGQGTTFRIFFPAVLEPVVAPVIASTGLGPRGTETILLAEDEARVRQLIRLTLEKQGYTVLEAKCGEEAVQLSVAFQGTIHLLVTDVVMPGLSGRELAETIRLARPEIAVCYVSGYMDDAIIRNGFDGSQSNFLQKPFSPPSLVSKVREVLDHVRRAKPRSKKKN